MNSSPARRRRLIQTKIQEVDSRFSQRHQGLILADRLSMVMSIDTRDQIKIFKYYRKFLTMQESFYSSVEIKNVEKVLWKYSLWRAACNCKFSLSCLQPSDISSHSQDPNHFSYYPVGSISCEHSFSALKRLKLPLCGTGLQWTRNAWVA